MPRVASLPDGARLPVWRGYVRYRNGGGEPRHYHKRDNARLRTYLSWILLSGRFQTLETLSSSAQNDPLTDLRCFARPAHLARSPVGVCRCRICIASVRASHILNQRARICLPTLGSDPYLVTSGYSECASRS